MTATALAPAPSPLRGRRPLGVAVAGAFLALVVLAAVFAPLLAPYAPDAIDLSASLVGTGGEHLLGTDSSGQDLLSRALHGARTSLIAPVLLLAVAAVLGISLGVLAAWRGGWVDALVSRLTDVMYAFPGLLFTVLIIAVFGAGMTTSVLALGLAFTPTIAKYTRSLALSEARKPYVDAYRVLGMGGARICALHVVPNLGRAVLGYLVVLFGEALMSLATLSYLGFGAQPPSSDWGLMVQEGQAAVVQGALLPAMVPGTAIALVVVSFNVVGVWAADRLGSR
ncbi:ABC transporter permease [Streptomyces alfalfae]|uniref:ABC transporter permease n=1 Tax=Streptomyces alfalfae TaxID=1642299 RepID=A0A1P8TH83_9ACTN|nr:ABC transporter permease [Streptomyces alfalfae]AYA17370.1 ABC transporter permease [Streptomyces fradiae]APY86978.1 ABC transporter permease [Streptomyces alfalfae]QQC90768.1 ABC transporter permease [Streptomyces alfalfae]QUI33250.1 ABC transporter permease [Streptomyces alfalfae]RXX37122.1 ABC transporter permease [Streptomyces alfalfae]